MRMRLGSLGWLGMVVFMLVSTRQLHAHHLPQPTGTMQRAEQDADEQHQGQGASVVAGQSHRARVTQVAAS